MKYYSNPRFLAAAVSIAAMMVVLAPAKPVLAAGGAFAVDDAGVDEPGDCKVEAFTSFARNDDFTGVVAPACGQGSYDPGAQIGLRYTPHKRIDFDLIYGRNLTGERSDWITAGVNLRF